MTYTPITQGTPNWDVPVNAALSSQDSRLSTVESVTQPGGFRPSSHGLTAWTWDLALNTNSTVVTGGSLYLSKMLIDSPSTVSKLYWWIATAGVAPVATQNAVGLYNSNGTLLASTNVDSSVTTTGLQTTNISPQTLAGGTFCWIGLLFNASTLPALARMGGLAGVSAGTNLGLVPATYRFAINGTGQTALPSSITPSANVNPGFAGPWAAIGA